MSTTMKSPIAVAARSSGVPTPEAGNARSEACENTSFFGSAFQIGDEAYAFGDVDRDTVGGAEQLAREERLVVGRVVPGRNAGDEGVRQRLGVFHRLERLGRVDDHLVVLVDRVGAMTPQDPVQPGI